jgi:hypothetical protein
LFCNEYPKKLKQLVSELLSTGGYEGDEKLSPTLHQHQGEQGETDTFQYSDKDFGVHSSTHLGHAAHHSERACDGGEDGDDDLEQLAPIEGASALAVLHGEWCGVQ